ncbi:acyl-CoA dehydrogenase family protein [Salinibacterium sp. ZJ70]|uniref:acyl-CoA dehydrogenase family protein n=1 Tax=Salinibacterium sp. ZJ70 TaxID=2708084 RepID=UPI001CD37791|nr:acyl-CoA dehydrogenase family protein [Salinibacterium sp. ZJ70]
MDTGLTEEQSELAGAVRALLERHAPTGASRAAAESPSGFDAKLWGMLVEEMGAAAVAIPEEFDGLGATLVEAGIVLEELGYSLAPTPYLASAMLAGQAILAAGEADSCARLLPAIASGSQRAALAWAAPSGRWDPTAVGIAAAPRDDAWMLTGSAPLVLDGEGADVLIVLARTPDGPALFELGAMDDATITPTPALDPMLRVARVELEAAQARLLSADADVISRIATLARASISAMQVGVAQRALDMTVEYSLQRVQFGRQIGSFQALKHRMADMHVKVETARSIARAATAALAAGDPDAERLSLAAKSWCSEALSLTASEAIQLHGGIAITWEHDAHLIFKRAHALGQLFGQPHEVRRAYAAHQVGASASS